MCNFSKPKHKNQNCTKHDKVRNLKNRSLRLRSNRPLCTRMQHNGVDICSQSSAVSLISYCWLMRPACPLRGGQYLAGVTRPPGLATPVWEGYPRPNFFIFLFSGLVSCFNTRSLCFTHVSIFATMAFLVVFVPSVAFLGLRPYSLSFLQRKRLREFYFGFCILFTSYSL